MSSPALNSWELLPPSILTLFLFSSITSTRNFSVHQRKASQCQGPQQLDDQTLASSLLPFLWNTHVSNLSITSMITADILLLDLEEDSNISTSHSNSSIDLPLPLPPRPFNTMSTRRTTRATSKAASSRGGSPAATEVPPTPTSRRARRSTPNAGLPRVGLQTSTSYGTNSTRAPATLRQPGTDQSTQINDVVQNLLNPIQEDGKFRFHCFKILLMNYSRP